MIGKRFGVALFCMSSTLLLPIAFAKPRPIPAPPVNNQSTPVTVTDQLGGHDRYLTNISTDKPIYRVRDKVYVRGVVMHAINHKPHLQGLSVAITVRSPKGEVAAEGRTTTENGVWTLIRHYIRWSGRRRIHNHGSPRRLCPSRAQNRYKSL